MALLKATVLSGKFNAAYSIVDNSLADLPMLGDEELESGGWQASREGAITVRSPDQREWGIECHVLSTAASCNDVSVQRQGPEFFAGCSTYPRLHLIFFNRSIYSQSELFFCLSEFQRDSHSTDKLFDKITTGSPIPRHWRRLTFREVHPASPICTLSFCMGPMPRCHRYRSMRKGCTVMDLGAKDDFHLIGEGQWICSSFNYNETLQAFSYPPGFEILSCMRLPALLPLYHPLLIGSWNARPAW